MKINHNFILMACVAYLMFDLDAAVWLYVIMSVLNITFDHEPKDLPEIWREDDGRNT